MVFKNPGRTNSRNFADSTLQCTMNDRGSVVQCQEAQSIASSGMIVCVAPRFAEAHSSSHFGSTFSLICLYPRSCSPAVPAQSLQIAFCLDHLSHDLSLGRMKSGFLTRHHENTGRGGM